MRRCAELNFTVSDKTYTIFFQTVEDFLDFRDNWFVGKDRYGRSVYQLAGRSYSEEQAATILGGECPSEHAVQFALLLSSLANGDAPFWTRL